MKKILALTLLVFSVSMTGQNTFPSSGNVGIGTSSPVTNLHINSSISSVMRITRPGANTFGYEIGGSTYGLYDYTSSQYKWRVGNGNIFLAESSGNVGIGTVNPNSKLQINSSNSSALRITRAGANIFGYEIGGSTFGLYDYTNSQYRWRTNGNDILIAESSGKVGIGTSNPDKELTVNGTIHSKEVLVDLNIPADYVFQKYYTGFSNLKETYKMPTLEEVEAFTKENHHLPNIPSAGTIQKEGMQLSEMTNLLLQKIEELTLYTIEQEKRIKALEGKLKKKKKN
jgi:hypothetical protein